ncbi:mucosa-associated lymphoid tissue lymphoma translocation protein 1 isoform X2 [Caretta caretta]|uniref:mucosa-associated lymphoid tissue lymphoma translocation protein 1 isoform X2 n=1 Tax=Caretta caretta TaxID=8467 RepID=UPI003F4C2F9B
MADGSVPIGTLGEGALARLCELLDNCSRGWRKLAEIAGAEKRFKCSEEELEMCSLKVLEPCGSPSQCLLQLLSERDCTLKYLLCCLDKMGHTEAFQFLSSVVQESIRIVVQPESQVVTEGTTASFTCRATGPPGLNYQWFCGKQEVPGATSPELVIDPATLQTPDWYICRVNHRASFTFSRWARLQVKRSSSPASGEAGDNRRERPLCLQGPQLFASGGSWREEDTGSAPEHSGPSQLYATDKVALLMGNMNYLYHKHLKAPMVDVHELTNLLRQLDFKVVSLLDLSKDEMQMAVNEFLLLLDKGVYGLLYYAGHGYENFGNSFMVPIDAPRSYTSQHCLCVQSVLQSMQQRQTGLNIFLLDMCRKRNLNDDIIPQVGALQVTANIVFGYATCVDAEAYELSQGELFNGIFVSFLKRWLLEEEKITVLLDKVAEDMGTLEITKGRQALELRSNLSERRALTDPIKPSEGPEEISVRNLQWAKAHVLPESRYLQFDCGARVQLGFAAEFSNILIIYTRIVEMPQEITRCEAKLTDVPEELDVDLKFTNKESPEEMGSSLALAWSLSFPDCCLYSRLCGLQKLRKELVFTVCLQYQYQGLDDFIEESQSVNIGKPLIAKLNLCVSNGPGTNTPLAHADLCADALTGSFQSIRSMENPESPAASETYQSLPCDSHLGNWCSEDGQWVNTPEENLSPEFPGSHSM